MANKVILTGRLTKDPDVRYNGDMAIARYTLAVDRPVKNKDGTTQADFIRCVAFGKLGEFAERYLAKGVKILIEGRIQTGSYEDQEGKKMYTTDVVVERHEFCESKGNHSESKDNSRNDEAPSGFSSVDEDDMPF